MDDARRNVLLGLLGTGGALTASLLQSPAQAAEVSAAALTSSANRPRGGLSTSDVKTILNNAQSTANGTPSPLRTTGMTDRTTKMHIVVVDRTGAILGVRSMEDAWVGSLDIAIAKARTAAFFSSDENALTSRVIGRLSQAHDPDSGDGPAGGLWGIWASNQVGITGGPATRNGIITFPGGVALYKGGKLVGAIGVSGDGVDQDEAVAFGGSVGFLPTDDVAQLGYL